MFVSVVPKEYYKKSLNKNYEKNLKEISYL